MGKYFGTDGIRGVVNGGLDAGLAFKVGQAAAMVLAEVKTETPFFTIGKDTRLSGDMLESAMISGLCAAGANVMRLGVVPTPAVAYITRDCGADAGIVISASHNPYEHNGIKIFNGEGYKLSDELEERIEELIDHEERLALKMYGGIGYVIDRGPEYLSRYMDHVVSCAEWGINRLKVMIDCSHGAASRTVNGIFGQFPLDLDIVKNHPNGLNINDNCGSTHMEYLSKMVVAGGFDVGIAFDGDADRCIIVDEEGSVVDGDKIMGLCAVSMLEKGRLKNNTLVATVMSNLGLHEFAKQFGITLECTSVGDRNVLERMLECGYNLGGEQSGHTIFLDDETTGDGQLTAVKFLSVLSETGRKVSELVSVIPTYPQTLINIQLEGGEELKKALMEDAEVLSAVKSEEEKLADKGRVLVRASGTENLIRVMVEANEDKIAENCAEFLTNIIKKRAKDIIG